MRPARFVSVIVGVVCGVLGLGPVEAAKNPNAYPCEDVNNDGVCTPGVDPDITAAIQDDGRFYTPNSIVIPAGVKLLVKNVWHIQLAAGQNITFNGNLTETSARAKKRNDLQLFAENGKISIGDGVTLQAGTLLYLLAQGDVEVGSSVILKTVYRNDGMVWLYSKAGNVQVAGDSLLKAHSQVFVTAQAGAVSMLPGSRVDVTFGHAQVRAGGDVAMNGSSLDVPELLVSTKGQLIDLRDSRVMLPSSFLGYVLLSTNNGTIDLRGTQFTHLDPGNLHTVGTVLR